MEHGWEKFRIGNVYSFFEKRTILVCVCGRCKTGWKETGNDNLRKFYWNTVGKSSELGMFICQPSKSTILIRVCGRYQTGRQDRKHKTDFEKFSWKTLTWENRHHFLTMYIWVALKESFKSSKILWRTTEMCSNSGFLLEPKKNYRPEIHGNLMQKQYLLGPMTWKVTQRSAWKDIANFRIKHLNNCTKVATPCMDDHQFQKAFIESVGELSTVCSQIVLKCLYLARFGRPCKVGNTAQQ